LRESWTIASILPLADLGKAILIRFWLVIVTRGAHGAQRTAVARILATHALAAAYRLCRMSPNTALDHARRMYRARIRMLSVNMAGWSDFIIHSWRPCAVIVAADASALVGRAGVFWRY